MGRVGDRVMQPQRCHRFRMEWDDAGEMNLVEDPHGPIVDDRDDILFTPEPDVPDHGESTLQWQVATLPVHTPRGPWALPPIDGP